MPPRTALDAFREVWLADFGFTASPGGRPSAVCLAARELRSGRTMRLGQEDLRRRIAPPYPTDRGSLYVAFDAPEPLGCHLAMGWHLPARVLDLSAEFRNRTNGVDTPHGRGLYGALAWHGLDAVAGASRPSLDALAASGGPWTASERGKLLDRSASRVEAITGLLVRMLPDVDVERAILRGRYMAAVARMEHSGVPIDVATLGRLRDGWDGLRSDLIREVDSRFGVYDGGTFRPDRWEAFLAGKGLAWPRTPTGVLALDEDTFKEMARHDSDIALMRELRSSLARLRPDDLAVGADGRNRTSLRPFASKTGRNQPSSSRFIFGPSTWLRGLIKPGPGRAVAYVDWSQQEFGIAAGLSRDAAMTDAYLSGDPYLAFGQRAGRIPQIGTRQTHRTERERFKACALGVLYGMGAGSLARRIDRPAATGRELLAAHRAAFPAFWKWSDATEHEATALGWLQSVFGWTLRVDKDANPRSLRNFPCQANGAEMLRLACCLATERGISVVAPVHDALMVEGPATSIEEIVATTREAMAEASGVVLDGFRLRSEARVVWWPDRYMDDRGREFWTRVTRLLPDAAASARV